MKILIMNRSYFPNYGGVETSIYNIAKELNKIGHVVFIFTRKLDRNLKKNEVIENIRIIRYQYKIRKISLLNPLLHYIKSKREFGKLLNTNKFDLIISRDSTLALIAYNHYKTEKDNIIYIPPVYIKNYIGKIRWAFDFKVITGEILRKVRYIQESYIQGKVFRYIKNIVVFSHNLKDQISRDFPDAKSNITVSPPGYSSKFKLLNNKEKLLDKLKLPKDKKVFLYVGRVAREKNVEFLVDAFMQLKSTDAILVIVGDGNDFNNLKSKITNSKFKDFIILKGATKQPEEFYNIATYFVLPTKYESFGQVILESLACGTPVIGFKNNYPKIQVAIDEIIQDGINGFVCTDYGIDDLTKTLNTALKFSDSDNYYNMRASCLKIADEKYSWEKFTKGLISLNGVRK